MSSLRGKGGKRVDEQGGGGPENKMYDDPDTGCADMINRTMVRIWDITKTAKRSKAWNDDNTGILLVQRPETVDEDHLTENIRTYKGMVSHPKVSIPISRCP